MSHPADLDVVIVGAGAAGIAAARALGDAGLCSLVVEARSRAGGRAFTHTVDGFPLDMGCGWLHSADRNPLVSVARAHGFTVDETPPPWQSPGSAQGFPPGEGEAFRAAQDAFYERLEAAASSAQDCSADGFLEPGGRWNALIDAVSTYVNGTELDRLSVLDFSRYHDSEVNFRVVEGYGALIAHLATQVSVAFETVARVIDFAGPRVRIETDRGVLEARAALVATPTNVLASGGLRFNPELPDKTEAAARLPLGLADKLFLAVDRADDLPENGRLFGAQDRAATGAYHYRPFGRPLIEGYFGGACARELEAGGLAAFADFAIEELVGALGSSWRKRLRPVAVSGWARDPFALGSYSHALPGCADARAALAAPVDERLFFAGEATSPHNFSTAHGAWESGLRAAGEIIAALRAP